MNTAEEIIKTLRAEESVDLESSDSCLTIWFRKFFGTQKEFHFQLNGKPVYGCKSEKTATRKINSMLNKGFVVCE